MGPRNSLHASAYYGEYNEDLILIFDFFNFFVFVHTENILCCVTIAPYFSVIISLFDPCTASIYQHLLDELAWPSNVLSLSLLIISFQSVLLILKVT